MSLFPEVQVKAQEEIDRVIGCDRLPTIEDRPNLPFIDALVKETLRWCTIIRVGMSPSSQELNLVLLKLHFRGRVHRKRR